MKYFLIFLLFVFAANAVNAQFRKIDSTLKIGKVGYRVRCFNRNTDKNELSIKPEGFDNAAREMDFFIKGRIAKVEIDDLNNDSYPDLVVYFYTGEEGIIGMVYAFMSSENKSIIPVVLPDVQLDGKLKDGYKGHDQFSLLEGKLMQQFPIYKTGDDKDKPTGGKRVVQYQVVGSAETGYKFKMIRFYETKN
jgi:hypothetical protein